MKAVTRRADAPGNFARRGQDTIGITANDWDLSLLTPMLGGSAKALSSNGSAPLRLSELKHQLRFWWRALQPEQTSLHELRSRETAIFGGAAGAARDGSGREEGNASRIVLRMIKQAKGTVMTATERNLCGCPKSGLGPILQQRDSKVELIKAGWECKVRIETVGLTDEQRTEVEHAWRAALFFGGVGARTRRGFGSLFCAKMHTMDEWYKLLAAFNRSTHSSPGSAAWPTLGGSTLWKRELPEPDAVAGWRSLIDGMGGFRQGPGIGRAPGTGGRPGRSYWAEPDTVRRWLSFQSQQHPVRHPASEGNGWFPRAAYGLPLSIKFTRNGRIDPYGTAVITPAGRERWPSPVILKTIRFDSGSVWQVCLWLNHRTPDLSIKWSREGEFGFPADKPAAQLPRGAGPDDYAGKVITAKPGEPTAGVHPVKALADYLHLTLVP